VSVPVGDELPSLVVVESTLAGSVELALEAVVASPSLDAPVTDEGKVASALVASVDCVVIESALVGSVELTLEAVEDSPSLDAPVTAEEFVDSALAASVGCIVVALDVWLSEAPVAVALRPDVSVLGADASGTRVMVIVTVEVVTAVNQYVRYTVSTREFASSPSLEPVAAAAAASLRTTRLAWKGSAARTYLTIRASVYARVRPQHVVWTKDQVRLTLLLLGQRIR
jgi:hypothetical protein